jgi:hypothetical protein
MYNSIVVGLIILAKKSKESLYAVAIDLVPHSLPLEAEEARSRATVPPPTPGVAYKRAETT